MLRKKARVSRSVTAEAKAIARQASLMWLHRNRDRHARPIAPSSEKVVVFVHGFMAAGPVFDPMRAEVEKRTQLPCFDFTYKSVRSFEAVAHEFDRYIAHRFKNKRISLVGHSLGGLVCRYWMQDFAGPLLGQVDSLITLATPHAGTRRSVLAMGPLSAALAPHSTLIQKLHEGHARVRHIPHSALVAGLDSMVVPTRSAAAIDGASIMWFESIGHNEMLFDERIHHAVAELVLQATSRR